MEGKAGRSAEDETALCAQCLTLWPGKDINWLGNCKRRRDVTCKVSFPYLLTHS